MGNLQLRPQERTYRHYGNSIFDPSQLSLSPINRGIKPRYCFWASPTDSELTWCKFCTDDGSWLAKDLSQYFDFRLTSTSKICVINTAEDLLRFIDVFPGEHMNSLDQLWYRVGGTSELHLTNFPDFELASTVYDGLEVNFSRDYRLLRLLDGWDVDSLVIWDPNVVVQIYGDAIYACYDHLQPF